MMIRSQDKKSMFNLNKMENLQINKNERGFCVAIYFVEDSMTTIGRYSTEAKAIKVLNMIQAEYLKYIYGQGGQMATSNATFQPFAFIPPKVIQMPQDSEVEE